MFFLRGLSILAVATLAATVAASSVASADSVNIRPITDWTAPRAAAPTGNWTGPFDQLPEGYFAVFYRFAGAPADGVDMSTVRIDGTIVERRLASGNVEVKVHLNVRNAPITIYRLKDVLDFFDGVGPQPIAVLGQGADGSIDYVWELRVITADFGLPLVGSNLLDTPRVMAIGNGTGQFTSYAANFGFTPGAAGQVHVVQTGLFAVADQSNGTALLDAFPGELVNLRETGR